MWLLFWGGADFPFCEGYGGLKGDWSLSVGNAGGMFIGGDQRVD